MVTPSTLGKLFKEEFTELLRSTTDICLNNHPEKLNIQPQVGALATIVEKLDDTLLYERESDFTKMLEQLDLDRDHAITGIKYGFLMNSYHHDPARKSASQVLLDHLEGYGPRIIKLNYEAQSTVLINLIEDYEIKNNLKEALELLELTNWVASIKETNQKFRTKYQERITATSATERISFSAIKPAAIKAYEKLVNRLNAYIELDDTGTYNTLKSELYTLGERYQQIVKRRKSTTNEGVELENIETTV
ncbi:DUF6261 family protein [Aquimarina celericrescens]|uniref:DUF6261 family protein n=1 Tax=Aquimarina celericrescens TaxID=1964542 RepID=A0ABW5B231_9FLAO|nr:hypothetical protein [Aquimarina celericrescens]